MGLKQGQSVKKIVKSFSNDVVKSKSGSEIKESPASDKYVQSIFARAINLDEGQVSKPMSLDHGLWLTLVSEDHDDDDDIFYSGIVYEAKDDDKLKSVQKKPVFAFRSLTIRELVWCLYDEHIIHEKSEEQVYRDKKVDDIKTKVDKVIANELN